MVLDVLKKKFMKPSHKAIPPSGLRVVSFNVHYAKNPQQVALAIQNNHNLTHADVILLQEVEYHLREGLGRADQIANTLGFECVYAPASIRGARATHGLAVLTKLPVLAVEIVQLPFFRLAFRSRRRIALRVELQTPQGPLQLYNVHLDTRINIKHRLEQLMAVVENFKTQELLPTVIAGDLNTIQAQFLIRTVPIFFADQRKKVVKFLKEHKFVTRRIRGYTMKQGIVRFNLDGVYVNGLRIINSGVEREIKVSDHAPIWVDLELAIK